MNLRITLTLTLIALLSSTFSEQCHADTIVLTNGRTVEGRVVSRQGNRIRIEVNGTEMVLDAASVESVEAAPEYENTLIQAKRAFDRRRAVDGIDLLFAALKQGASRESVMEIIEQSNGGISGSIRASRPSDRPVIRRSIHALVDADLLTDRSLFYTAQNLHELEDWDGAADALRLMDARVLRDNPSMRQWALDFMRLMVKRLLARGDFEAALAYVERMRVLTGEISDPQLPLAQLSAAANARDRNDYDRAFSIIANQLYDQVPEISRNRAWYTIQHLKTWARANNTYTEARHSIEPIRRLFPVEYAEARNEFLQYEAQQLLNNMEPEMALRLLVPIPAGERSEELQEIYRTAYHQSQVLEIGEGDPLELLQHGRWCADNGMLSEAIEIFAKTSENANLKDLSDQLLTNTRRELDTKLMEEAQEKFAVGDMPRVMALTDRILNHRYRRSHLADEAEKIREIADKQMAKEKEMRPYQAEVFYQQAERAFFMQKHQEAFNLINLVINDYSETPAAGRAAGLLPDVVRGLEIAYLEGQNDFLPELNQNISVESIQKQDRLGQEVTSLMEALNDPAIQ